MSEQSRVPAVLMRGGASKAVFFHGRDLPGDAQERERLLLRVMGSPDPYGCQLDGLGGASTVTSRVVVVEPSQQPMCDVDCHFGQVAIEEAAMDQELADDDLAAAAAQFAIEERLLRHPLLWDSGRLYVQPVVIWLPHSQRRILAEVPCRDGLPLVSGTYHMQGVAGSGARITLHCLEDGAIGEGVLPLGELVGLEVPGIGPLSATLVDAGGPVVFIRATDLGLSGRELPESIN